MHSLSYYPSIYLYGLGKTREYEYLIQDNASE
jgi:hypothetical protein